MPKKILSNKSKWYLAFILLFALVIRIIFFQGVGTSDALLNTLYANDISKGIFPSNENQANARIGLLIPVSMLYSIFGVNNLSSGVLPLIISLLGILLIFLFGKMLFSEKTGLIAAFLLAVFPLDVLYATRFMSDLPSAVFSAFSVYLFLRAEKEQKLKALFLYAFSGISFGIAFSIREMAVLTLLFYIGYIIYNRKIRLAYAAISIGFLSIFALELYFFAVHTGNPFYRFSSLSSYYSDAVKFHNFYGRLSFPNFFLAYPYIIFSDMQLGYFYAFIALAIIYCLVNRKKETNLLIVWIMLIYFYLNFGSSSLTSYEPFLAVSRYLHYISIPSLLLLANFLSEEEKLIKKFLLPFVLSLLFFTSIIAIYDDNYRHSLDNLRDAYNYATKLDKTIYTDYRTIRAFNFFSGYDKNLHLKDLDENSENIGNIKDAYVIINHEMIKNLKSSNAKLDFPDKLKEMPKAWVKAKEIGTGYYNNLVFYYAK